VISDTEADQLLFTLEALSETGALLRKEAMNLLSELEGYDWCGVYRLEGETLVLDEYVGDPTEHDRIPVGRGVCGTAVAEKENQVIEDVRQLDNYLSCSLSTRSEIVVLVHRAGEILGQIDIDGHQVSAFDASDERLLEQVGAILARKWD